MKQRLLVLAVIAVVTLGFVAGADTGMSGSQGKTPAQTKIDYTCPMHPEVRAEAPGRCPKCGMNLVRAEGTKQKAKASTGTGGGSPQAMIAGAAALLDSAKGLLAREGNYSCCTVEPCDECALGHKNCRCAEDLKAGKGVCSQCYGAWQRGDGNVDGVDPKTVKGNFHRHNH